LTAINSIESMRRGIYLLLIASLALLPLIGCTKPSPAPREKTEDAGAANTSSSAINAIEARKRAIAQYNLLFRDKFFFNPVDHKYEQFPELMDKQFYNAELKDGYWQLTGEPPAGVYVNAKVSADGKWVQLTSVGFSPE